MVVSLVLMLIFFCPSSGAISVNFFLLWRTQFYSFKCTTFSACKIHKIVLGNMADTEVHVIHQEKECLPLGM
jgi:hypothetical protein